MKLRFIKDTQGIYNIQFTKGTIKTYYPWNHTWQGMTEPERVQQGIFIECHGMGEFDKFLLNQDVEVVDK